MRPTAARLLGLYPRAWRERYGEEFVATAGPGPLHLQQIIDIVAGAIDAWLSADVRHATAAAARDPEKGTDAMWTTMLRCDRRSMRFTTRDALIGGGITIGTAIFFSLLLMLKRRVDLPVPEAVLMMMAFPGSYVLSMPVTYLKGQPWKAQVAITGGTLAVLLAIGYLVGVRS